MLDDPLLVLALETPAKARQLPMNPKLSRLMLRHTSGFL